MNVVITYILNLLSTWGSLYTAPFRNLEMLWIIIPIYLNWIFAEFFQEKRHTSLGNAISNAAIIIWAAVDWSRTSVNFYQTAKISLWNLIGKIFIAVIVLSHGVWIVYDGIKGKKLTHYIGRIRVVSYIALMITPIVYETVHLSFNVVLSIIVFFPLFYYIVELIDKITPDPVSIKEEEGESTDFSDFSSKKDTGLGDESSSSGLDKDFDIGKNFKL